METRRSTAIGLLCVGALVAVAMLAAASLTACGSSGSAGTSPAAPKTIAVTPVAQTGTTVDAAVGDTIVVSLEANATTGYSWEFTPGGTMTIVSSKYVPDPNPSGLAGKGGTQRVTIKVTKTGTSDLTGTYRQQWNSPSPGAQPDFSLTVNGK